MTMELLDLKKGQIYNLDSRTMFERYEAKLLGREVTRDEFDSHDSSYEGESQRKRRSDLDDMVECHIEVIKWISVIFVPIMFVTRMKMDQSIIAL